MSKEVEFTIKAKMDERWVDYFCSMLQYMEFCGKVGHSGLVSFYSDGDGDFRPKFEVDIDFKKKEGLKTNWVPEIMYDAG